MERGINGIGIAKTFTVRNYFTGALLYYMHLCHKGRDDRMSFMKEHLNLLKVMLHVRLLKELKRRGCKLRSTGKMQTPPPQMLSRRFFPRQRL